jgi:hypothetical protein|tara:strand:- start:420 stop:596 length:177 start_codon:yes stop_codon:yes gene_type:complete
VLPTSFAAPTPAVVDDRPKTTASFAIKQSPRINLTLPAPRKTARDHSLSGQKTAEIIR